MCNILVMGGGVEFPHRDEGKRSVSWCPVPPTRNTYGVKELQKEDRKKLFPEPDSCSVLTGLVTAMPDDGFAGPQK